MLIFNWLSPPSALTVDLVFLVLAIFNGSQVQRSLVWKDHAVGSLW